MANERVLDPVEDGGTVDHGRRRFLTATTAVVGAVGAGFAAVPFIKSWNPSARAKLAGAPVTMDISAPGEGQRMVDAWRGPPIGAATRDRQRVVWGKGEAERVDSWRSRLTTKKQPRHQTR